MCRLSLLNNKGIRLAEEKLGGIKMLFDELEESFGGHGNGVAIYRKDGTVDIKKGAKLTNKEIAKMVLKDLNSVEYVIYHTRLASVAKISDENCHPFECNGKVMVMNGTERAFNFNNGLTDTENLLVSLATVDDMKKALNGFRSAFIGSDDMGVFVVKNYGDLVVLEDDGAIIFASEFPEHYFKNFKVYVAQDTWRHGEKIKKTEEKKFRRKYAYIYHTKEDEEEYIRLSKSYYEELEQYYKDLELCRISEETA